MHALCLRRNFIVFDDFWGGFLADIIVYKLGFFSNIETHEDFPVF